MNGFEVDRYVSTLSETGTNAIGNGRDELLLGRSLSVINTKDVWM